ncbi:MAG: hypothetical protein Q9214_003038 [Letrouitia sp. 1 TL-2023]
MFIPSRLLLALATMSLLGLSLAGGNYKLVDTYDASNFFSSFNFFAEKDPTNGFVQYKTLQAAAASGLIGIDTSTPNRLIYLGVDHESKDPAGRASVRVSSQKAYTHGLFITDLEHMPGASTSSASNGGECGAWPAHWLLAEGVTWPQNGEIDILEGANDQVNNQITLHTAPGCSIDNQGFSGQLVTPNCDVNAPGQDKNAGCAIRHPMADSMSFGAGFNAVGGGVYATEWTSQGISVWHFPRVDVPADISSGNPDPTNWGLPVAKFAGGGCNIDQHFQNHNIIFDTTFCGDWAGNAWETSPGCKAKATTCQEYVQNNPEKFTESYWVIRSVKVYEVKQGEKTEMRRDIIQ